MPCGSGRGGTKECATQRQTKVLTSQQVDAFERNGLRRTVSVLRANRVLDLFHCDLPGTRVPSALGTHACPILGPLDSLMTLARTIGSEGPGLSRSSTWSSRPPRRRLHHMEPSVGQVQSRLTKSHKPSGRTGNSKRPPQTGTQQTTAVVQHKI